MFDQRNLAEEVTGIQNRWIWVKLDFKCPRDDEVHAVGVLSLAHDEILADARSFRAIYSVETMHKLLCEKAAALATPVCWEPNDLALYYTEFAPEPMLPMRRSVKRPTEGRP